LDEEHALGTRPGQCFGQRTTENLERADSAAADRGERAIEQLRMTWLARIFDPHREGSRAQCRLSDHRWDGEAVHAGNGREGGFDVAQIRLPTCELGGPATSEDIA
jgi:hypothetical protein